MSDSLIEFAVKNRYNKFCDYLDKEGFSPHQIYVVTLAILEFYPGKKELITEILLKTHKDRY